MSEKISAAEFAAAKGPDKRKYRIVDSPQTEHDAALELLFYKWVSEPIANPIKMEYPVMKDGQKDTEGRKAYFNPSIDERLLAKAKKQVQELTDIISKLEALQK